jgi:hypothetical protein
MRKTDVVQKLTELGKELGQKTLVCLKGDALGGWFVADARHIKVAELKAMGLPSETLAVALVVEDSKREKVTLNELVKKLGKYADSAVVYAEIGPLENPLLQVCSIRAGTTAEPGVVNVQMKNAIIVSAEVGSDRDSNERVAP